MNDLLQYGVLGIVVVGLAGYILIIEQRHKKERKEWGEKDDQKFDRISEMSDDTNKVIRENSNILSGLKTLLENQRRNAR